MTLIDTSSLVHFLRGKGKLEVKERVRAVLKRGDAAICDLVAVELWMGVGSAQDERDVGGLLALVPLLPMNENGWMLARKLAAACRKAGTPVPSSDVVIAACALAHRAEIDAEDAHFSVLQRLGSLLV